MQFSNSTKFRLHYYFLNLHLRYAVRNIIIYFTCTITVMLFTSAATAQPIVQSRAPNEILKAARIFSDYKNELRNCAYPDATFHTIILNY